MWWCHCFPKSGGTDLRPSGGGGWGGVTVRARLFPPHSGGIFGFVRGAVPPFSAGLSGHVARGGKEGWRGFSGGMPNVMKFPSKVVRNMQI